MVTVPPVAATHTVVTLQVPDVVPPTVTEVVTAVLLLPDEVSWMAMVSPLLKPVTGPATKDPPLREMAVQFALHVAVRLVNPPPSVTVLLVMVELTATPVWSVKLKALAVGVVVTLQVPDVVVPTVTEVVTAVL